MSFLLGGQFCSKTTFEEQWRYKLPFHTRHLMQKNDPEQTQGKKTKKNKETSDNNNLSYQGCLAFHMINYAKKIDLFY